MGSASGEGGGEPVEGGKGIMLAMDSEEDPQHKAKVMETLEMGEQERTTPSMKHRKRKEDLPLWVTSITWVSPGHESPDTP